MPGLTVLLPVGRIGPAEAEHHILHDAQRQIVGMDLQREHGEVDVEEEIQVDMRDVEHERRVARGQPHPHLRMSARRSTRIGLSPYPCCPDRP